MSTATTFDYIARDRTGATTKGTLEGSDKTAVTARLREMGFAPVTVDARRASALKRDLSIPGFKKKVGLKDLAVFSRQFATMIDSGLSLLRALNILADQVDNPRLAEILKEIRTEIESGRGLSDCIADYEEFPKLYVAMVRAGEVAGMLDSVLLRVAETLEKDLKLRRQIKSAMTYPVVVLIMAIMLTIVMLVFIVPVFVGMFDSLGGELPFPTKVLLAMSTLVRKFWYLLFILPIAGSQGFKRARKQPKIRRRLDALKLKVPVFGPLFHKIAISRFARNFGSLLRAGVPILMSLEITAETVSNGVMAEAIDDVQVSVREGESVARPLATHPVFPSMVVQMMAVGEETGAMDDMLIKVADFYDDEVSAAAESLTAMLEPLMIGVLGGIVGSMVVALYMPMFKIFELIE
jgi:type IV pilus assembly protein PilC